MVVTIAVVLVYIGALTNVALGILILLSRYRVPEADVLPVSLLGAAIILVGLLTIAIASGLARGSRFARFLITVYFGIQTVLHIVAIATTEGWDWNAIVQLVLGVLIVGVLWLPPGARHFVRNVPAT